MWIEEIPKAIRSQIIMLSNVTCLYCLNFVTVFLDKNEQVESPIILTPWSGTKRLQHFFSMNFGTQLAYRVIGSYLWIDK